MPAEFKVNASELDRFGRGMREASLQLDRELRAKLKQAAEPIRGTAIGLISPFSKKIPETIRIKASARGRITIEAGGPDLPTAYLLERGNRGSISATTFRHPVFGHKDRAWVEEPMHPYVRPAVEMHRAKLVEAVRQAMRDTFQTSTRRR